MITDISSIRLLVVSGSPPESSRSWPFQRRMAPQPPGPGLPEQAPSVQISMRGVELMLAGGRSGEWRASRRWSRDAAHIEDMGKERGHVLRPRDAARRRSDS